eukprot:504670-Alexandrium_andersonii.AAC.1
MDTAFVNDMSGAVHALLSIVDNGSCFHVAGYLRPGRGMPPASAAKDACIAAWASWAGMPQAVM